MACKQSPGDPVAEIDHVLWVLPVTVNLNGLATGAMKVNCDHERTLKVAIIPLIQLIGVMTVFIMD